MSGRGEAQVIKALHYLIGKAHLLQAGVDTLTEREYALLEDVARWYDEQQTPTVQPPTVVTTVDDPRLTLWPAASGPYRASEEEA